MKLLSLLSLLFCAQSFAQVHVNGYTRSNGTYVAPHYRSAPDNTTSNNYSTVGNTNPYTGSVGTKPVQNNVFKNSLNNTKDDE